jgi:hypothetical protein
MNYPNPYDVLYKSDKDDSTETLFTGSWDECCIYTQAYIDSVIAHTNYKYLNTVDAIVPTEYDVVLMFRSPLISQSDFFLWIDQAA